MMNPYLIVLIMLLFGLILGVGVSALSFVLGPKKPNARKLEVYECGLPISSTAERPFSIKFYLVAIFFILFDIESIFMYLWATNFDHLGWFGIVEMGIFIFTLIVGYLYIVKRGALRWDRL